jgi:ferredoxin-NADP reductase
MTLTVDSVTVLADAVLGIRFVPVGGGTLPIWQPGAHITLFLPNGLQRQYSLCGDPAERDHFDIAVLRTDPSQGGSDWIHENVTPGMTLPVTGPRNHFDLEPAQSYLFIAGGIGITPIMAMIESLPARRDWTLVYRGRSLASMAFATDLAERYPGRVRIEPSDEQTREHVWETVDELVAAAGTAEVYCCGPESLMTALAEIVPAERMHLERFVAVDRTGSTEAKPVQVTCRKSKIDFEVPADQSILSALEEHGLPVLGSCRTGVCGTCEVRVLEGTPEHLDSVLDDAEKDRLGIIYPCVSRASTPTLTLNL